MDTRGLDVKPSAGGCSLRVKVRPGARAEGVQGVHAGALKVSVTAPPERGRANEAVVRLLATALGVARGGVEIVAGHASRDKTVRVAGLAADQVLARLEAIGP